MQSAARMHRFFVSLKLTAYICVAHLRSTILALRCLSRYRDSRNPLQIVCNSDLRPVR